MPTPLRPFVSIVMPALNEQRYIADAIASVLPRSADLDYELLVLDGGSSDRTPAIVHEIAAQNPRVKLLHNERRTQSAAMNIAASACDPRAALLVRADCHATYPADFVARCVDTLCRVESASVVVPMRAVGSSPVQKAIAAAQNSRLGNGGSKHRLAGHSGFVDHGHHAAIVRSVFLKLGGYDETAPYNEDAEFDARLVASGGRIYLDGSLTIDYYPRASIRALSRQYFRHGWGRANTLLKHGKAPKLRQAAPVLMLLAAFGGLSFWPLLGRASLTPFVLYVGACVAWAAVLACQEGAASVLLAAPAAIVMHMSWAGGFLVRVGERQFPRLFEGLRGLRARLRSALGMRSRDAGHKA